MDLNKFTIKSQEAIQQAQQLTLSKGNQSIETGHLLKAMLLVDENVIPFLLKKLNVQQPMVDQALDRIITGYPKVSGGNAGYLSQKANETLQKAIGQATGMGDDFVSIEHLLLALLDTNDTIAQLLKDAGVTQKGLKKAIEELRKGSKVTSASQEETYNALNKYARNLNDLARKAKLDPVIGRDEEIRRVLQILTRRTKNNPILIG
ncbi:MAG: Clp protease N-terminal domain-containing protein, partial [Flavobacteriales bacterium]